MNQFIDHNYVDLGREKPYIFWIEVSFKPICTYPFIPQV